MGGGKGGSDFNPKGEEGGECGLRKRFYLCLIVWKVG